MGSVAAMMAITGASVSASSDPLTLTYLGSSDLGAGSNPSGNFSSLTGGSAAPSSPFYLIGVFGAENADNGGTFSISGLTFTSHEERSASNGKAYARIMGTTTKLTSLPTSFSITTGVTVRSAVAWYAITGASSSPATTNGATSGVSTGPSHSVSVNAGDLVITVVGHEHDQALTVDHNNSNVTDAAYEPNNTTAVAFGSSTRNSAGTLTAEANGSQNGDVAIATAVYR